jgi:N-acetylglucosamine-6-phosphate deacetylase
MNHGYFDLQVNGYAGVDFNSDALDADGLRRACERLRSDGVGGILATIITENLDVMCDRIARIVELRSRDSLARGIIHGLHIEGPFLSTKEGYPGAHPRDAIRPADIDSTKRLLDAGQGLIKLLTLAPECDAGLHVTKYLSTQNVCISAGHTDASLDELNGAIDAGLSIFTHLGNGCPMIGMHRHDNIIQRALSLSDRLWITFIADGAHVSWPALRNYLRAATLERSIIITDAIAPASLGPGEYVFARWKLKIGEDLVARSPDGKHLVGAVVTMRQSELHLRAAMGLSTEQCEMLLTSNPRRAIGMN